MPEFPETSDSLIVRVRDPTDREAWDEFEQIYRPVIFRIARARGLQDSDARDLVQQVLMSVSAAIGRYRKAGKSTRFRNWLSRVARNAILKALARQPRDQAAGGSEILDVLSAAPAPDPTTDMLIAAEYRRELYFLATCRVRGQVRDTTWLAFEMTVVQQESIEHAAQRLGLTVGSVYAARSRVMRRLRREIEQLTASDEGEST